MVALHYSAGKTQKIRRKEKTKGRWTEEMDKELTAWDRWGEKQEDESKEKVREAEEEEEEGGWVASTDTRAPGTPCP